MQYFLCKYIPPRGDFLSTMSAEEREFMSQHGTYLNDLLSQGYVVAHGPVIDPSGGYGVSLFQINDEEDISDYTKRDPIVSNGIGHYEHHPMLHLRTKS